jgi:hypothetical protein
MSIMASTVIMSVVSTMTMQTLISPEVVLDVQDVCDVHDPNNSDVRSVHDGLDDCNIRESMMVLKAPFSITVATTLSGRKKDPRAYIFQTRHFNMVLKFGSSKKDPNTENRYR